MKTQVVLITGATSGIGRHAALHLAKRGHHVIATGRNEQALAKLRDEASPSGGRLDVVRLDVTSQASVDEATARVDEITGGRGVDALVNNAGYGLAGPVEEIADDALQAQFDTNVFGLLRTTRAFLPKMRARGRGRVVNVSSIGGRTTFPFFGAYHATKYAVEALSDALRREVRVFGVDVVLVEPGPITSDFSARTMDTIADKGSPDSPYAAIYAEAGRLQKLTDKQSYGPEHTSRAIQRAIESRSPSARYVVPRRLAVMLAALTWLPTRLVDWLMFKALGLDPKKLRKPVARAPELQLGTSRARVVGTSA